MNKLLLRARRPSRGIVQGLHTLHTISWIHRLHPNLLLLLLRESHPGTDQIPLSGSVWES